MRPSETFRARFGEALKNLRVLGISQADIARRMGTDRATITYWKTGRTQPDIDKIFALARALNVSVAWLLGLSEEPPEPVKDGATRRDLLVLRERVEKAFSEFERRR